jgi:formyltetrahydrofolate-dependent phosphoribosylglycinamide formyltransferase
MFEKLKKRWHLNDRDLILVFLVFAITGSLTAFFTRQITTWLLLDRGSFIYYVCKLGVLLIAYPILLLLISLPFGQFRFFLDFERRAWAQISGRKRRSADSPTDGNLPAMSRTHIAIFASGAGSNALQIIRRFQHHPAIQVSLVVCNKPGAGVTGIAAEYSIPVLMIEKNRFLMADAYVGELKAAHIDFIVLAGFLWKIPETLIKAYPGKIINIHPALLPKYGGKGMYGAHVHTAVLAAGDKESGITIHYVDEQYDHGAPIFQSSCPVLPTDTPETLAQRVHALEHEHFPRIIEEVVKLQTTR